MKKIRNNYTNFILTVVVVLLFANLFKGEIIKPAHANIGYQAICISTSLGGYEFVANENSIVQLFRRQQNRFGVPVNC